MPNNIELENLEIYKEIINHMTESLWIWNSKNNTIYINSVFCDILWYKATEIIWKNYTDFFEDKNNKLEKLKSSKKTTKYETFLKAKSWEKIPVLCGWTTTQNWWIVLTITDLSELKTLKKAKDDLIKLNKTKDEFISIVWHELRTPLSSIRWYLSMILDWDMWEINSQIKKSLNHTYDSSVRLIKLVNDILSIWKIESWKMEYHIENIELKKLIEWIYSDIHLEMENKKITFKLNFEKELENLKIKTDEAKIKQVVLNLLTNALKFTKEWWEVLLNISKNNNKIKIEVKDNWIWIPKDKLEILFSKFSQIEWAMQRQNTSWLWLGLAISKKYIEALWSKIIVESELNKWTSFYFELKI